jgi:glycoside hydrolase-like protein
MKGLDYAFGTHPSVAAIKAAGASWVGRYVSTNPANDGNGKNLIPSEKASLLAGGISIILFAEEGASRMLGGRAAGIADAKHFDNVVKALGMPGAVCYFCADWDASESEQAPINAYLDGAASVIGLKRVGIYGGYYPVKRALDAGKAAYACQTRAWSGGQWDSRANVRQGAGATVGGASVDIDDSRTADFGQWPRPAAAPVPPPVVVPPKPPLFPAPGGLTAVVARSAVLTWQDVKAPYYRFQVASGTPAKPGVVAVSENVKGTTASVKLAGPGPWIFRVQAPNCPFSPWHAIA